MTAPSSSSLFYAMWRQGLKDVQDVVLDPWHGAAATHSELGTIGNQPPQLITQDMRGDQSYQAMLERYSARAEPQAEQSQEIER